MIAAKMIVALCGLWLVFVAWLMVYRPYEALNYLSKMASTHLINYSELGLRLLAGIAFIIAAPATRAYLFFHYFGWFLVVSALVLMLVPRKWHQNYALYWARKLTPFMVRALGPFSLIAGIAILRGAF